MPVYEAEDGARLHYDVLGEEHAPLLVVVAGGAARHPAYLGDLAGLSERYRLVLPHLRGVGRSRSASLAERGSWWRQAADLVRLRGGLGLERLTVVAHSAGTRLAVAYAAQFPERVAALVLITPPAAYLTDVASDSFAVVTERMTEPGFAAAMAARTAGPDISTDDTFTAWQLATAPVCYASWTATEQAHSRVGRYWLDAAREYLRADAPAGLADRLRTVPAPTLVIAGAHDAVAGVQQVLAAAELFPNGRAVVIDGCGHMPWVERPAAFREAVDGFLEEVLGTPA